MKCHLGFSCWGQSWGHDGYWVPMVGWSWCGSFGVQLDPKRPAHRYCKTAEDPCTMLVLGCMVVKKWVASRVWFFSERLAHQRP